ncbi:serine/threonine-protein kinase [Polyangium mundeleinium]|uniref:serine/threonine-protein kinase n=1 Tax=Polyangium mundeleinium TaxID=2995306 RepID=UPI00280C040B|nr:protein kinase [Polyangium mundeleinium]
MDTAKLTPGTVLGQKYQIIKRLGAGGMGEVLLASDLALDRFVAIKILRPELSTLLETDARFRREARLLARLSHPNVVVVHAFGSASAELHYIVMEYVRGESLDERLRRVGRLEPSLVGHVMAQVGSAVAEAHRSGIVHRDLKPGNVLLTTLAGDACFVKVVDFGVAKAFGLEGGPELAVDGQVSGTPAYMAPEQIEANDIDGRADIYALGIMACELLTGARPFDESGGLARLFAVRLEGTLTLPSRLRPDLGLSAGIDAVIGRALRTNSAERYQTVEHFTHELLRELRAFGAGAATLAERPASASLPAPIELSETIVVGADGTLGPLPGVTSLLEGASRPFPTAVGSGAWAPREAKDARSVRSATVLYVDLSLGALDASVDLEEHLDCLAVVGARLEQVLARHGGEPIGPFTDRALCLFGPEGAAENDAERALDAALSLRAALGALSSDPTFPPSFRLGVRLGIDAGRVVSTQPRGSGVPFVSGAPVFEARGLARAASSGEIVATHAVLRRVRGLYETTSAGAEVPGRRVASKKSTAYLGTNEIHGVRISLVGRDEELSVLRAVLARARMERQPEVLVVTGPAGVGKSRLCMALVEELEEREGETYYFEMGRSTPSGQGVPYEPFLQAIRHRARVVDDDGPEQVRAKLDHYIRRYCAVDPTTLGEAEIELGRRLGELLGVGGGGDAAAERDAVAGDEAQKKVLFDAVAEAYRRLATRTPLLFLLEDFEWATATTKALLGHVIERLAGAPALFVLVSRAEGAAAPELSFLRDASGVVTIPVEPLEHEACEALIRHVLRALIDVPAGLVRQIAALAGGVPLIVEETVHQLVDEGVLVVGEGTWRLSSSRAASVRLPETLEQLLLGRLDRLEPRLSEAVEAAAVAGRRFWPSLLGELLEGRFEPRSLADLVRRGIFAPRRDAMLAGELDYAFTQAALQEVAQRRVPKARRRALHRAAALWLERATGGSPGPHDDLIGHHFREAGELALALPYKRRAAERAMRTHAIEEAVRMLEASREILLEMPSSAMDAPARLGELLSLAGSLAHELVLAGSLARAIEVADDALARAADLGDRADEKARVAIEKGWALQHLSRYADARESFVLAGQWLGEDESLLALRALTGAMGASVHLGDHRASADHLRRVLESHEKGDAAARTQEWERALSSAYRVLGNGYLHTGRYDEGEPTYQRAIERAIAANAPVEAVDAYNGLAALHYFRGRLDLAESTWREALEQTERWDLVQHRSIILSNVGELELARGDARAAIRTLSRAEVLHERLGSLRGLAEAHRALAECHLVTGELDAAKGHAERCIELADRVSSPYMRGTARRTMARVLHASAKGDDALRAEATRFLDESISIFESANMNKLAEETRALAASLSV